MLKRIISDVSHWLHATTEYFRSKNLSTIFVFCFFFLVFLWAYMSLGTVFGGDDHFFHFKFAEEMRQNGFFDSFRNFKALYFSDMAQGNKYFIYYNFLYYLILTPFTFINPLFLGMKLYAVCAISFALTALYWVIKRLGVQHPFILVVGLISVLPLSMMLRLFSSRPYTLAPILLLLLLYFIHKKKYFAVFTISFVYVFWHSATFFLLLLVAFVYYIFERFYGERGDYKNLLYCTIGFLLSLLIIGLIAPGFELYMHNMIADIVSGVFKMDYFGHNVDIPEGAELYPVDFFGFLAGNYLFVSMLIICIVGFLVRYISSKFNDNDVEKIENVDQVRKNRVILGALFFLTSVFLLAMIVVTGRFQDFLVFFAVPFIILYFDEILRFISVDNNVIKKGLKIAIIITVCYLSTNNLLVTRYSMSRDTFVETWKPVGEWLNQNVPKGDVVFNASWDWFPQIYYHSPSHNYVIGIEPRFLYSYSQKLYFEWVSITSEGHVCDKESCKDKDFPVGPPKKIQASQDLWYKNNCNEVADAIVNDFHSHWVVSTGQYKKLNNLMDHCNRFTKRFSTILHPDAYIYEVK